MLGDGILRRPQPAVIQDHHPHGRHRLGHREDAENGVEGHGLAGREVLLAQGAGVDDLTVAGGQGDQAGDNALVDPALKVAVDGRQAGLA